MDDKATKLKQEKKPTPPPKEKGPAQPPPDPKSNSQINKALARFWVALRGKKVRVFLSVEIELPNGKVVGTPVDGVLEDTGVYDIILRLDNGKPMLVTKHAVVSVLPLE